MLAFSIAGIARLMLTILLICAAGYMLGRISIKGVSLGTAGVFIAALIFGALFPNFLSDALTMKVGDATESFSVNALKIIENLGLIFFVTSVGFIAGPNFFTNFKKNFKSYILLGLIIIILGGISAIGCIFVGRTLEGANPGFDPKELTAMIVGLLSGSLTSTPAFSAAKETVEPIYEAAVTVGHGIAYLFGVVGVVLFVQLVPKFSKACMEEERKLLIVEENEKKSVKKGKKTIEIDAFGFAAFSLTAVIGLLVGAFKIAKFFTLGTTGGCLIASLVIGYIGKIGPFNMMPQEFTLKVFRELGLMLFLIGAGIAGGISFVEYFDVMYFVYGVVMTILPMIGGFFFAKYVLKLSLLNNLGSITGGMTSTPALGTLIHVSKTEDVASAYAATYPIALIAVVLVSQFLIIFF